MFLKMRNITFVLLFALSLGACSEYQKVLKEDDIKAKYVMADSLYNQGKKQGKKGKLKKSLRLLDQIVPQYRGKPQGERLAYIYADTYYQLGSYFDSGYQFERFTKAYPRSEKAEEAYYKGAESYYEVSPRYSLDQTETHKAIDKFQQYISRYPDGEYIGEANELVGDLRDKLDKKQSEENTKKYKIWKEVQESKFVKSNTPDPYYESEEYKEFLKGVNKKYDELVAKGEIRKFNPQEQVFYGERGGRYRIRYNKNGEEYRDYF